MKKKIRERIVPVLAGIMLSALSSFIVLAEDTDNSKEPATNVTFQGAKIRKQMAPGADEVPEGAELVWRLERYDGSGWAPASGVEYMTFDGAGATCDQVLTTGEDGEIRLRKTASGDPVVRFMEADPELNLYGEAKEGELRLIEVPELSDSSWGLLSGYGKSGQTGENAGGVGDLSRRDADTFINSNRRTPVEIGKEMDTPSDIKFTMNLEQVLSASDLSQGAILETRPAAGISYTVYDMETDAQLLTDTAGADGEIRLRAGQYARVWLPDGTVWTVEEEQRADHVLEDLYGIGDNGMTRLEGSRMLIRVAAEPIPVELDVQAQNSRVAPGQMLDKEDFSVRVVYSDGQTVLLTEDQFVLEPDTIPADEESRETFPVKVIWPEGGLEEEIQLKVVDETEITREMVDAGVKDADTGLDVTLNTGDVTIPEYIIWEGTEYHVTGIAAEAFGGSTVQDANLDITGIHFPDSIRTISDAAFGYCENLTGELELPESLTGIGYSAFTGCSGLTGNLAIPEGVTMIGGWTFNGCSGFNGELILPEGLKDIGQNAFEGCSGLSGELTLPEGITSIGVSAFKGCTGFTGALTLPETTVSIGGSAFAGCTGLSGSLKLPEGLENIENTTFQGCSGLSGELILPEGIKNIGASAFEGCSGFTGGLKLPEGLTNIGYSAFKGCSGFTGQLILPEGLTNIDGSIFAECSGFTGELVLPEGITGIGGSAFERCSGLTGDLVIPEGVTIIGGWAFNGCSGLDGELKLPESLTTVGQDVFHGCTGLHGDLFIPAGVESIGNNVFTDCGFQTISVDNTRDAIFGSPWGWSGGGDAVIWLREE